MGHLQIFILRPPAATVHAFFIYFFSNGLIVVAEHEMVSKERLSEWRGVGPSVRVPMILCTPCTGLHRWSSEGKVVKDKVCVPAKAASFVLTTELQRQNFEISLEISVKT